MWPIQKGHFVKIWVGHFMDSLFEIEMERPIPGSRDAPVSLLHAHRRSRISRLYWLIGEARVAPYGVGL
jgi:hypothetical protein